MCPNTIYIFTISQSCHDRQTTRSVNNIDRQFNIINVLYGLIKRRTDCSRLPDVHVDVRNKYFFPPQVFSANNFYWAFEKAR